MYSYIDEVRTVKRLELLGVTKEEDREIPLNIMKLLTPWDDARLMNSFRTILLKPNSRYLLKNALKDLLHQYEVNRLAGRHDGPELQGMRLFWLSWDHVGLNTFQTKDPDHRELIVELNHLAKVGL
jgi:hypothetical protein